MSSQLPFSSDRPRIIMTGGVNPNSLQRVYKRYFDDLGCEVRTYTPAGETRILAWQSAERVLDRLYPKYKWVRTNTDLIELITRFKPDIVLIFKGMEIFPDTIRRIKRLGSKVCCYNADHPYEYFSRGSGNQNVARSTAEYDLYITYSQFIRDQLSDKAPNLDVSVIPFGHEVDDQVYSSVKSQGELKRVCFIGNPDEYRVGVLRFLANEGLRIDVFGIGWDRFFVNDANISVHGPVFGLDMQKALRRYRVQLNFFRPHNRCSHNMRTFEVPAVGGIMLAPHSREHREFFEDGKEAFFYSDESDLRTKAHMILDLPEAEANIIREAARSKSVTNEYHYLFRTKSVLNEMNRWYPQGFPPNDAVG